MSITWKIPRSCIQLRKSKDSHFPLIFFFPLSVPSHASWKQQEANISNFTQDRRNPTPPTFLFNSRKELSHSIFTAPRPVIPDRKHMATMATAELCDSNASHIANGDVRVLHPIFQVYGQRRAFFGPVVTLKVFEDNVMVRELLETRGEGKVLVVDGGGSMRCALVGGNLGQIAQNMGWVGIIVNGCIRDVDEINSCDVGVRALGSHPLKSNKKGFGDKHAPVYVGGHLIRDGEWLYADSDGILVSKFELSL